MNLAYQGSLLGVEVDTTTRSYFTQLITPEDEKNHVLRENKKDGFLMKGNTYTFQISQVPPQNFSALKYL